MVPMPYGHVPPYAPLPGPHRNVSQPVYVHDSHGQFDDAVPGFAHPSDRNFHGSMAPPGAHGFPGVRDGRGRQHSEQSSGAWSRQQSQDGSPGKVDEVVLRQAFITGFGDATEDHLSEVLAECGQVETIRLHQRITDFAIVT